MRNDSIKSIFHIGMHKTGSTFLQLSLFKKFESHFYSIPRRVIQDTFIYKSELEFDVGTAKETLDEFIQKAEELKKMAVFSEERLGGLIHEGGGDCFEIARRIKFCFPNAKIILVIREQNSMISSSYMQYIMGYGSCSLEQYLQPSTIKRSNLFSPLYLEYHRIITFYYNIFDRKNILVLPYELLKIDNKLFLKKIILFINKDLKIVDFLKEIDSSPKNTSIPPIYITLKRYFNPFILQAHKNLGYTLYFRPLSLILRCILYPLKRIRFSFINKYLFKKTETKIRIFTGSRYAQSNRKTSKLIGYDLQKFGYKC